MTSTRSLAVTALAKIFEKSIKPKAALEELYGDIDKRERAFLMELVYGVLRHRDHIDWMFKGFLKKPSGLSMNTLNNLRLALYQIAFMRVPEWAAVNEAVEIEKAGRGRVPLVNAVLRNFLRYKEGIVPPPKEDQVNYISVTTSHPKWLVKRWINRFGFDEALRLAEKNNEIPVLTIRMQDETTREEAIKMLTEKGITASASEYSPGGIVLESTQSYDALSEILPFNYVVQDEAAQIVTYLLNPSPGERVLDACAAPGGKATHIAGLMKDNGEVVAVEFDEKRIEQLKENVSRTGLKSIRIVHGNAKDLKATGLFDRILLDAPCSAIGVIRRNPDVKYRHSAQDLARFKQNQASLLNSVSMLLKSGGIMVYSVCSTEPEEGEEVIKGFLQANHNFSIIKSDHDFLTPFEVPAKDSGVFYRTFPHKHNMDGFFAAILKKD